MIFAILKNHRTQRFSTNLNKARKYRTNSRGFHFFKPAFFVISCLIILASCANTPKPTATEHKPFINQREFTGLHTLGESADTTKLDYALDSPDGIEIPLTSCSSVKATSDQDIVQSQYHFLQLMKVNCMAADYYFSALSKGAAPSVFPNSINEHFVKNLPGITIPDLGGESLDNRNGNLSEVEPELKILNLSKYSAELSLAGDLVVNYIVMARGDFNGNGYEDLLLRLDWHISTAFGKGFDLLIVSQTPMDTRPKVTWRRSN